MALNLCNHIQMTLTRTGLITKLWIILATASCPMFLSSAIERFCSVMFPFRHRTQLTTRVCWYCICGLWMMHFIFEICVTILFSPIDNAKFDSFSMVYFVFCFLSSQVLCMATFISLKKIRERILNRQENATGSRSIVARIAVEKHFVRTIAVVCLVSGFSQLPWFGLYLSWEFADLSYINNNILSCLQRTFTVLLLSIIFAINPFLVIHLALVKI